MKLVKEMLGDTKPKNVSKITKAFEQGACSQYMPSFMAEAVKSSAIDFPKVKCLVTDNFFCSYTYLGVAFSNSITVVPLDQIVNLYRSNINQNGEYDYDWFYLALELCDGRKLYAAPFQRNAKTYATLYEDVVTCVRGRINVMEGIR